MNYLKVFWNKICGYLIDTLFAPKENILTNENLHTLPKAVNDNPHIFSIFYYKNATVKKLIRNIKYKGDRNATLQASKVLYDYLLEDVSEKLEMSNFAHPLIIPIPATKHRMKEHGFNQCERIVKYIEKLDNNSFFHFTYNELVKIKENESQAHTKNRIERLNNIKNSFAIKNREVVHGQNIILIDDVWTTGATLEEARKELLEAGARSVVAYTIAH
jgi:competence protein ComFC